MSLRMLAAVVLGLVGAAAHAAQPIPPEAASRAFAEAEALSAAEGGALWGRRLAGPMLFVDRATRALVANRADEGGVLKPAEGHPSVFTGTLPEDRGVANTAIDWLGTRWTMVMWPLPDGKYTRGRLLMHECFHRIQDEVGLPAANPSNDHLETSQGRVWLQLEWRALSEALIRSGEERRQAAADALAFRRHRRTLFGRAAEEERGLELNEGLAEYTGYRACGLPESVLADRVAVRLDGQQGGAGFVRNFAYTSGPAYGLLLDAADPQWRKGLSKTSDLGDMLGRAMSIDGSPESEADLARAAERYDGASLIAAEKRREATRQARVERHRQRFVEGPVLRLEATGDVNYTYDPNGVEAIEGDSSVFATIRVSDAWGVLEVTGGGAWVERKEGRIAGFRVPAPADAEARPLEGEGWTLRLAPGWSVAPGARAGDLVLKK